jgi:hypothetical protein
MGECSIYVVKVHSVLFMCVPRGGMLDYVVKVHPVLSMEVSATRRLFDLCS